MIMSNETEFKLLGTILLLEKEDRQKIFSAVEDDYFSDDLTKEIFTKFCSVFKSFPDADESAFVSTMDEKSRPVLLAAMNSMMSPEIAKHRLDDTLGALHEQYINRKQSEKLTELMMSENVTPADIRRAADELQKLSESEKTDSGMNYLLHYNDEIKFVPSGFEQLDTILGGGFFAGTLVTVGARPSTGKTTFALNIAAHNPERKVLFISIEMTSRMIYDRLVANQKIADYALSVRHKVAIESVKAVINTYKNLTVIDDISHVEKISELIYAEKPELVIIDFVQIITSKNKFPDNRQRIDYISQMLKSTAKATGACIMTLSQLTRAGKDKPTMCDLKESGGLEQDSDYVILLHRPYVNDKSNKEITPEQTDVTLDKNKFGSTRELKYRFDGTYQIFTECGDVTRPVKNEEAIDEDLPF